MRVRVEAASKSQRLEPGSYFTQVYDSDGGVLMITRKFIGVSNLF